MSEKFDAMLEAEESKVEESADGYLNAGDECPEDGCNHELHVIKNERNPIRDSDRHPSSNAVEVWCTHHEIVQTR